MAANSTNPKRSKAAFAAVVIIVAAVSTLAIVSKLTPTSQSPAQQTKTQPENTITETSAVPRTPTLAEIARAATTWEPAFNSWYGRAVSNFAVQDLDGKTHRLSDYRGKNIMVVLWATWCPPCQYEVPHLIELRKQISIDKLVILALSAESPQLLKQFVAAQKINYTVASIINTPLPTPFSLVSAIPSSFFINPEGNVKFAAEGPLALAEAKAVLQAER
jgi:peroxiredoxin